MPSLQLRRGLAANRTNITPAAGELIFTTDTQKLYVGDGTTAGGVQVGGQTDGTVTSVAISGGTTGLTTSGGPVTSSGTITLAGTLAIANGGTGQTTASAAFNALAPTQTGNSGKFLTTNGTEVAWGAVDAFPTQTGNSGKYLTTDGTTTSWSTVDSFPAQANNSGKVLVTNGTSVSWSTVGITNQLYVNKGGNDSTGDGSVSRPFLTIGAALSYANTNYPVTANSGTQIAILIGPGSYGENITINRPATHLFGAEGKLKSTFLSGSITVNPALSFGGIFQTNISLNNLFVSGGASDALTLAGTVQCSLDVNNCYLYSDSGAGFTTTSTASGGNRIRLYNTDITTVGTAVSLNVTNTTNCIISYMTLTSASTTNAINLSGTITLSIVQTATSTATNIINVASGTVNIGYCAFTTTKANGNGINIAAGATVLAGANTYNVVAGTGKAVTGAAGSVYVRGGNYYVYGTNSGIGASVTTLNMQGETAGTDIISTVPTSVGGTGLTTFGAANRAIYSTSASALTAGTLPVAAGGTGVTSSTGSGSVVLSTSPTLTTPNLGVPSAATLTNATGLPLTTGVTGTLPIANGGTGATTAAGAVTNLIGYTPLNKAGDTMSGTLILAADPSSALHAATKQYVDNVASGLNIHTACVTATTAALTATYNNGTNGAGATLTGTGAIPTIGGVSSLAVNDRVLVKNQADQTQNGIYIVTQATAPWILTRATDFDNSPVGEVQSGDMTYVQQGTLAGTQWAQITTGTLTLGTSNIVFTQFGGPGTLTGGTGIDISNNVVTNTGVTSLTSGTNISVSGSTGSVTVGFTGTLPVTSGGTGSTTASGARTNLSAASSGANSDITSLSGLTTALSVAQGGTGATTAADARTNLSAASSGANSDITSITGLTTALAATQGGTGQNTWATGDLLYASGSNTLTKLTIGSTNQVLTVVGGVPAWAAASSGAAAGSLTGTTLASNVVSSSLTSVGTLSSLTVSGSTTFGTNYTETRSNVTASASTTLDCATGNIFNVTMSASITTLTFSNVPAAGRVYNLTLFLNQDAGGSKTITWPAAVKWPGGTAPTLTTTGNKTDILNLVTHDGGVNWYGFVAGQNY